MESTQRRLSIEFDLLHSVDQQLPLSDDYLAAVKQRVSEATTGPWQVERLKHIGENWSVGTFFETGYSDLDDPRGAICGVSTNNIHASELNGFADRDAAFIAHARQDIPLLLLEIERLRGIVAKGWQR